MTSEDVAAEMQHFISKAAARINGVGAEQYSSGDTQQFETMSLDDLYEYIDEELLDVANYAVMLSIRINRLRKAIHE